MELWQRGIISEEDTNGLDLSWGNEETVLSLVGMIAHREGYGDVLAEGVRRYAERIGPVARPFALHVKGMEVPAFDGRAAKGFALGWAVSSRGADHLRALPNFELLGYPPEEAERRFGDPHASDPYDERGKAELVTWHENFSAVVDSAEMCKYATFSTYAVTPSMLATLLNDVVGGGHDEGRLLRCGERIVTLERMFDITFGGSCRDTLPERIRTEPLPEGPARGNTVDLDAMIDRYYELRGWDRNGVPLASTLKALGLTDT
jgi:aldehyde:ferredoxin oxidoreductase